MMIAGERWSQKAKMRVCDLVLNGSALHNFIDHSVTRDSFFPRLCDGESYQNLVASKRALYCTSTVQYIPIEKYSITSSKLRVQQSTVLYFIQSEMTWSLLFWVSNLYRDYRYERCISVDKAECGPRAPDEARNRILQLHLDES